jgi:hypothetical protein
MVDAMLGRRHGAAFAGFVACLLPAAAAGAHDPLNPTPLTELRNAYYGEGVLAYCGLLTADSYDGFERLVRHLVLTARIDAETHRRMRIGGSVDADYQFGNHGIGGQRLWCATDGRAAERTFLDFRRRQLAGGAG